MSGRRAILGLATLLLAFGCSLPRHAWTGPAVLDSSWSDRIEGARIVRRPLPFGPVRAQATLDYLRRHADPSLSSIELEPRMIVVHWTAIPTLRGTWDAFAPELLPGTRSELAGAGAVNVSSHFLVARDGTIFQLLPETIVARHAIGLNRAAIGIENVGGPEAPLTPAQLDANTALVSHLARKYPSIRFLAGHFEYRRFESSPLWQESDPTYRTEKDDPGPEFLSALRAKVSALDLAGPPPE